MWGSDPEVKVKVKVKVNGKVKVKVKVKTSTYRGEGRHSDIPNSIHSDLRRMKSGPPKHYKFDYECSLRFAKSDFQSSSVLEGGRQQPFKTG